MIDLAVVRKELEERHKTRRYIGASGIGESCAAYHALSLRGFPGDMPDAKLLRIFREGHRIEQQVVDDLTEAGHLVEAVNPANLEQWEYTSHGGHHVCHLDGFITLLGSQERMTLEVKSMNRAMFARFKSKGVSVSHPEYHDQAIDQLGLARINRVEVSKCFFVGYCKDNSEYHAEIVEFDAARFDELLLRVGLSIDGVAVRESPYAAAFKCSGNESLGGCFKRTACWKPQEMPAFERGCWHCAHAEPSATVSAVGRKEWFCGLHSAPATAVCDDFKQFKVTPNGK